MLDRQPSITATQPRAEDAQLDGVTLDPCPYYFSGIPDKYFGDLVLKMPAECVPAVRLMALTIRHMFAQPVRSTIMPN